MVNLQEVNLIEKEITVNPYLTYSQIQNIVNAVCQFDSWADREQNIDILLLYHATNLSKEDIEEYGHEALLQSGIIDEVRANVKNFGQIREAIAYTQSVEKSLAAISKQLPKIIEDVKKNGLKPSKK